MREELIREAAEVVSSADALLVAAGAGMGVDSGLPDFRGNEGFWRAYPPMKKLGLSFVDMANPEWFHDDPLLAWGFYGHRLNLYRRTKPHEGFAILKGWGEKMSGGSYVFTSNVDGQFQIAGYDDERIVECHGSIHHLQCSGPCKGAIWEAAGTEVSVDEETFRARPPLPKCPGCGALARPNILMFGDWNWISTRTSRQEENFRAWLAGLGDRSLVIVEIGAGSAVPTVRMTSRHLVSQLGARLIRINPTEPDVPGGQIGIAAPAAETLREIAKRVT